MNAWRWHALAICGFGALAWAQTDTAHAQGPTVTSGSDFNPSVSLILDGVYYHDDIDGDGPELRSGLGAAHDTDGDAHGHGGVSRGFNLRETELSLSASVDPYFDAFATLVFADGEAEVEEAYFLTRSLPAGLQVKGGRFFSEIGYLNAQHPHRWDFVDNALVYDALLGRKLAEDGAQLTWLPAWPVYARFGVEALQGRNERIAARFDETLVADGGALDGLGLEEEAGPRMASAFIDLAPDLGYSHALQVSLFGVFSSQLQQAEGEPGTGAFEALDGEARILGTDWVYRYDSESAYGKGDLTLQAEYLRRDRDLAVVASEPDPGAVGDAFEPSSDGWYAQAVYGIAPRWRAGIRHDSVSLETESGSRDADAVSVNLTFDPTEFSRLRLQWGRTDLGGDTEPFDTVWLQYQFSLGAHGAHTF